MTDWKNEARKHEDSANHYARRCYDLEALVEAQNKLLDTFRLKLDILEQETVVQLEAKNEKLMGELMSLKAAYYRANNRRWQAEEERDALKEGR